MANSEMSTKVDAEAVIDLTPEQFKKLERLITRWQTKKGLVIGSLGEHSGEFMIGFRQVPYALGVQIFELVNNYYAGGQNDANS